MRHAVLTLPFILLPLAVAGAEPQGAAEREIAGSQAVEVKVLSLLRMADRSAAEGDYDRALDSLQEALDAARDLPPASEAAHALTRRAAEFREAWTRASQAGRERQDADRIKRALGEARLEMDEARAHREAVRASLLGAFREAMDHGRWLEAGRILDSLEEAGVPPASVAPFRERLAEVRHLRTRQGNSLTLVEEWRNLLESDREQATPYAELLRFPDHWNNLTRDRQTEMGQDAVAEESWRSALRSRLSLRVPCRFEGTPFAEVLQALQAASGIPFVVDPSAREKVPDFDTRPISFSSGEDGMTLSTALNWLLRGSGLAWCLRNEAVCIATPENAVDPPVLEHHDVRDILYQALDHPGPKMEMGASGQGINLTDQAKEDDDAMTGDSLIEFLKEQVEPALWNEPQNTLAFRNGVLVVNAPPEVQRKIRQVLSGFRTQRELQVLIQARFLKVIDASLEGLGVNWTGLNATAGGVSAGFSNPRGLSTQIEAAVTHTFINTGIFPRAFSGAAAGAATTTLAVALLDNFQVQALLTAVEKTGKANVLNAPSLLCFNTQRANLVSLTQYAYIRDITAVVQVQAVAYDPEIGYTQTGIVFDVRPVVSMDRKYITLELRPTISELRMMRTVFTSGAITTGIPNLQQNTFVEAPVVEMNAVRTVVSMPDGGTLLIGGLLNSDQTHNQSGTPFLSKIPFLSALFSARMDARNVQNMLVLVKARVLDPRLEEEGRFGKP